MMAITGIMIVLFATVLTASIAVPLSFADVYISPKKQMDSGVSSIDVICKEDLILAVRDNGNVACVKETTAERFNWLILDTEFLNKQIPTRLNHTSSFGTYHDKTIGLTVGDAQDINNFRKNIENNYLPSSDDVLYEGLLSEYYFDTDNKQECNKLFCPSYSYAVSKSPFYNQDEYYLAVGLNSGLKESDFERKRLNLVIVLDVSNSMNSPINQYHYGPDGGQTSSGNINNDHTKTKLKVATESITSIVDNLNDGDKLSIVLFSNDTHLLKPLESMEITDKEQLKKNILQINTTTSGTNMVSGIQLGTSQFDKVINSNTSDYENRIILLTDAMSNICEYNGVYRLGSSCIKGELFGFMKNNAEKNIYTTMIGIGVDFNTLVPWIINNIPGANSYSIHSSSSFQEIMIDEFDFMVTPLVFDLVLSLDADGYDIGQVFGSGKPYWESTNEIMRIDTLFPSSKVEGGENNAYPDLPSTDINTLSTSTIEGETTTKGSIVILRLDKTSSDDGVINLKTNYTDRMGRINVDTITIEFPSTESDFYENKGIQKGVLLARYASLMWSWAYNDRNLYFNNNYVYNPSYDTYEYVGMMDYPSNYYEKRSIPLQVSEEYTSKIAEFNSYFKEQMISIGDYTLLQEARIMDKLVDHSCVDDVFIFKLNHDC